MEKKRKVSFTSKTCEGDDELVSTSQDTVISEEYRVEVIPVITVTRPENLYYHTRKWQASPPIPNLLSQVFFTCSACSLDGKILCDHNETQMYLGYLKLKIQFGDTSYGNYDTSKVPHACAVEKSVPEELQSVYIGYVIKGDGNCFFSAVSFGMCLDPIFGKAIRRCALIALNWDPQLHEKLSKLTKEDLAEQQRILSSDGVWASRDSVFIASEVLSRPITVFSFKPGTTTIKGTVYNARVSNKTKHLYLWLNNGHFTTLILKPNQKPPNFSYELPEFRPSVAHSDVEAYVRKGTSINLETADTPLDMSQGTSIKTPPATPLKNTPPVTRIVTTPRTIDGKTDEVNSTEKRSSLMPGGITPTLSQECSNQYITGTKPKLYCSLDDEYYDRVLKFIRVDFENFRDCQYSVTESHVKSYVYSESNWNVFTSLVLRQRKLSKSKEKSTKKNIYSKQRGRSGRVKFLNTMIKAGLSSKMLEVYLDCCDNKFGVLSEPINISKIQQESQCDPEPTQKEFKEGTNENLSDAILDEDVSTADPRSPMSDTSNQDKAEDNEDNHAADSVAGMPAHEAETLCEILKIDQSDLLHEPPPRFRVKLSPEDLGKCFSFRRMIFRRRKWPVIVGRAITREQKVCSFNAKRSPYYYRDKTTTKKLYFCKMVGKCGGECRIEFKVLIKKTPIEGMDLSCVVSTEGKPTLLQKKATGRQLRSIDRDQMKEKLKNTKASRVFYDNIQVTKGLRSVHQNELQKNKEVLRKVRSEIQNQTRLHSDPIEDLKLLREKYISEDEESKIIQGYIQEINPTVGSFKLLLYSRCSLLFHDSQKRNGCTTCFLDATGGIVQKMSKKIPLFYSLMGRNARGVSYPIAEFILEDGNHIEIMYCLARVKYACQKLRPAPKRTFADVFVVDWSWCMIHAVCKGVNSMEVLDYLNHSWDFLNGDMSKWDSRHSCIFICSSHVMAATKRLFSKSLSKSKTDKLVLNAALNAVARTQECFNLAELEDVLTAVIRVFGLEFIPEDELNEKITFLQRQKNELEILLKSERDPETIHLTDEDLNDHPKTLRDSSPYFGWFEKMKMAELANSKWRSRGCSRNPYYNSTILNQFGSYRVAYFPLWASAIPRAAVYGKRKFTRETNSVVESSFNARKTNFISRKNQVVPMAVRECFDFHHSTLQEAALKNLSPEQKEPEDEKGDALLFSELNTEKWSKGAKGKRKSVHLTDRRILSDLSGKKFRKGVRLPKYGLPNIGNTCFMNATFQLLLSVPEVVDQVFGGNLADPFLSFFNGIYLSKMTATAAKSAKKELDKLMNNQFPTGLQQDPHEFIKKLLLLEKLTVVKELLRFSTEYITRCMGCVYTSSLVEESNEFRYYPDMLISETMTKLEKTFTLTDYKCTNCGSSATKSEQIIEYPQYLLVFSDVYDNASDPEMPRKMDVPQQYNSPMKQLELPTCAGTQTYDLVSFVTHEGVSLHSGHYRAYVTDGQKTVCCDDDHIYGTKEHRGTVYLQLYKFVEK